MLNKKIIIIGSGPAGCTAARILADKNYQVEMYEIENHIGGHTYDYYIDNVLVHKYGPHIFHTSYENVWNFVNQFSSFNDFKNKVLVSVDNKLIQMPINFNSIKQLYPHDFNNFITEVKTLFKSVKNVSISELKQKIKSPKNLAIVDFIYENIYANYTAKMWGIPINEIDPSVLTRVKINLDKTWDYFPNDKYQGLPSDGYHALFSKMIDHTNIKYYLNVNALDYLRFENNHVSFKKDCDVIVIYTGPLDELFNNQFGVLAYRSLNIVFETLQQEWFQTVAVVNYPSDLKMTRICEYKHMTYQHATNTVISKEYPGAFKINDLKFNRRFYPISNKVNNDLKSKYDKKAAEFSNLLLLGRLAEYKYYDMDDVIYNVLKTIDEKF